MAEKTVLKALISKYAPMSTELAEAVKYDQSVVSIDPLTNEENVTYIDNDNSDKNVILISKEKIKILASLLKDRDLEELTGYKALKYIPESEYENVKKGLEELND